MTVKEKLSRYCLNSTPNLAAIKQQIEAQLKAEADEMLLHDAEVPLSNDAAKDIKNVYFRSSWNESNIADTEHVLLAILREKTIWRLPYLKQTI